MSIITRRTLLENGTVVDAFMGTVSPTYNDTYITIPTSKVVSGFRINLLYTYDTLGPNGTYVYRSAQTHNYTLLNLRSDDMTKVWGTGRVGNGSNQDSFVRLPATISASRKTTLNILTNNGSELTIQISGTDSYSTYYTGFRETWYATSGGGNVTYYSTYEYIYW